MDIARPEIKRQKRRRQIIWSIVGWSCWLESAWHFAAQAGRAHRRSQHIWTDTVKRGSMLRQVRGLGSLIPSHEDVRQIPAETEATVIRIDKLPGSQVDANTVLVEMANPQLEQEALDAQLQVKAAEAEYPEPEGQARQRPDDPEGRSGHRQCRLQRGAAPGADRQVAYDLGVISGLAAKASAGKAQETGHARQDRRLIG